MECLGFKTVAGVLTVIKHFVHDCTCPFPNVHLSNLTELITGTSEAAQAEFAIAFDLCAAGQDAGYGGY